MKRFVVSLIAALTLSYLSFYFVVKPCHINPDATILSSYCLPMKGFPYQTGVFGSLSSIDILSNSNFIPAFFINSAFYFIIVYGLFLLAGKSKKKAE